MNLSKDPAFMTVEELRIREAVEQERERRIVEKTESILLNPDEFVPLYQECVMDMQISKDNVVSTLPAWRDAIAKLHRAIKQAARERAEATIEVTPEDL